MRFSIVSFIIVAAAALSQAASVPAVEVRNNDTLLPRALAESVDKREVGQVQAFARGFVAMSQRRHARHPRKIFIKIGGIYNEGQRDLVERFVLE